MHIIESYILLCSKGDYATCLRARDKGSPLISFDFSTQRSRKRDD